MLKEKYCQADISKNQRGEMVIVQQLKRQGQNQSSTK